MSKNAVSASDNIEKALSCLCFALVGIVLFLLPEIIERLGWAMGLF